MKPASFRPWRNAVIRFWTGVSDVLRRNPITGIVGCCARAANGQAAAVPPISVMNSRRFMSDPKLRKLHLSGSNEYFDRG